MTTVKKTPEEDRTAYMLAAALLRARTAAAIIPLEREISPVQGLVHAVLSGKPVPRDRQHDLFGQSVIDIPEFAEFRRMLGQVRSGKAA